MCTLGEGTPPSWSVARATACGQVAESSGALGNAKPPVRFGSGSGSGGRICGESASVVGSKAVIGESVLLLLLLLLPILLLLLLLQNRPRPPKRRIRSNNSIKLNNRKEFN